MDGNFDETLCPVKAGMEPNGKWTDWAFWKMKTTYRCLYFRPVLKTTGLQR